MKKHEEFLPSGDGKTNLHLIVWEPDQTPKAVLQLVHGMVEYIDRYHDFACFLCDQGYACIGHDHLGHGKSVLDDSRLGIFTEENGSNIVIDDMHRVTMRAKELWPGVKNYILGHSMGSFMTRRYLACYGADVSGAVVMGTGWIPAPLALVGKTLSSIICKTKGLMYRSDLLVSLSLGSNNKPFEPARTPFDWLSRNTENVDRYMADPYCGFKFTASAYYDFFTVMEKLAKQENYDRIPKELPILIVSGELDPVGGAKACPNVKQEYDALGITDVTMILYPEDRHEILNEIDRANVFEDIKKWLDRVSA